MQRRKEAIRCTTELRIIKDHKQHSLRINIFKSAIEQIPEIAYSYRKYLPTIPTSLLQLHHNYQHHHCDNNVQSGNRLE